MTVRRLRTNLRWLVGYRTQAMEGQDGTAEGLMYARSEDDGHNDTTQRTTLEASIPFASIISLQCPSFSGHIAHIAFVQWSQ